jgi:hypothetical protein
MLRFIRRVAARYLRVIESTFRLFGAPSWRIERFNRLIAAEMAAAERAIGRAEVIVGIPFHREKENIGRLTQILARDLEERGECAAVVVVTEAKSRHLLAGASLASSSRLVRVEALAKPFGFGQRPGLGRRSWSHWALFQLANRLRADLVFIDADVRNADGWVDSYLDAIRKRGASIAIANYVRKFSIDDALVHVWDRLIFGALFKTWIAFRHGGDYAISRSLVQEIVRNPMIMRERVYTMDSAVIRLATEKGARIEAVWLREKDHAPISTEDLFRRLPALVESVFEDVAANLRLLLRLRHSKLASQRDYEPPIAISMRQVVGDEFRPALARDLGERYQAMRSELRRVLGRLWMQELDSMLEQPLERGTPFAPSWAKATIRILKSYIRSQNPTRRALLARAYVPVLQLGILDFLNRTDGMRYDEASRLLEQEYLPVFEHAWNTVAKQFRFPHFPILRKWPVRVRRHVTGVFHRLAEP